MRVLLAGLLFVTAVQGEESAETRYLRAWYTLHVDTKPAEALKAFQALLEERLPDERHAMCRLGIVMCKSRLGQREEAIQLLRKLRKDTAGKPELHKRVVAAADRLGAGRHEGTFKFHYQQGFSFKKAKLVDATEADVFFQTCAGGISSVTLKAPGGIMNLERLLRRRSTGLDSRTLMDAIAKASPAQMQLRERAQGDSRSPEADVFVMRTRDGGWAKLAIEHRGDEGGWTEHLVTIRYSYNPDRPVFSGHAVVKTIGGIGFQREPAADALEKEMKRAKEEAQREAERERARKRAMGGGNMPDPKKVQEVLFARRRFKDYELATFSFRHGIRDDPGRKLTRNNWDVEFGNGQDIFWVRTVTDDRSTIKDLGESTWAQLATRKAVEEGRAERVHADFQHIYFLRTEDTEGLYFTFMRVVAIDPGVACHIEWASLQGGQLKTSPGLKLSAEQSRSIQRLLAAHDKRAGR